jgi:hypothetical protein
MGAGFGAETGGLCKQTGMLSIRKNMPYFSVDNAYTKKSTFVKN